MGYLVDTPSELVVFIVAGDCIVGSTSEPGKSFTIILEPTVI